ncbi:MAG TPA: hypothetical protein VGN57_01610 [Pirellulaceae bacterium]|jgi:hypothetical protein|nr:hypothetical protein [Pirellulaceae bacterium]
MNSFEPSEQRPPDSSNPGRASKGRRAFPAEPLVGLAILLAIAGLWIATRFLSTTASTAPDDHAAGEGFGTTVALGEGRFHVSARIDQDGKATLITLGSDPSRIIDVESGPLEAEAVGIEGRVHAFELSPDPQAGDAEGRTSRFRGALPQELVNEPVSVEIVPLRIGAERFRVAFSWPPEAASPAMPAPASPDEERELYLEPGGAYTAADIAANGSKLPSEKFAGFRPQHDPSPQTGDVVCPITRTKANPQCSWVVAGRRYEFCCPPCIDEFVRLAKERPEAIEQPEAYHLR